MKTRCFPFLSPKGSLNVFGFLKRLTLLFLYTRLLKTHSLIKSLNMEPYVVAALLLEVLMVEGGMEA